MRCTKCHGGTVMLPAEPGKAFGYLVLCLECDGTGVPHAAQLGPLRGGRLVSAKSDRPDSGGRLPA